MSWQDRLSKASFKNFAFLTDGHEARYGRRLVTHEYPNADAPELEDFGLKAGAWKLNAYFIGPNYDLEANGFLAKLAESGADWLMHPWLGKIWVRAQDWSRAESSDKNGFCTISVDFVAGGRTPYVPAIDKVDVAIDKLHALSVASAETFDLTPMSADALTAFMAEANQQLEQFRSAISLATLPLAWANSAVNLIQSVKTDMQTLLAVPAQYAATLLSVTDVLSLFNNTLTDDARLRAVSRITRLIVQPHGINKPSASVVVAAPYKINIRQHEAFLKNTYLIAAAHLMLADYQDTQAQNAALKAWLLALETLLPSMPEPLFSAALDARAALVALLKQPAPVVLRQIVNALPAVVLAGQMALQEDVFIAKNKVTHPLFVQGAVYG